MTGTTFLAHVRYATTGKLDVVNTHPFLQDGRIFAHNGVVEGLDLLDERLTSLGALGLVQGQTDSERVFALITACIRERDGDVSVGLVDADRVGGRQPAALLLQRLALHRNGILGGALSGLARALRTRPAWRHR